MSENKIKILRVTMTRDFIIEMYDDKRTKINGWTIEEIIEDWFKMNGKDGILEYHATRDDHLIGNSTKYISHKLIDPKDVRK